jgi:hypothetical protein
MVVPRVLAVGMGAAIEQQPEYFAVIPLDRHVQWLRPPTPEWMRPDGIHQRRRRIEHRRHAGQIAGGDEL